MSKSTGCEGLFHCCLISRQLQNRHSLTGGQIQVSLKRGTRHQVVPTVENLSSKRVRVEHVFDRFKVFRALNNSHFHRPRIAEMAAVILNWLIR
jgi:hypothetical protein